MLAAPKSIQFLVMPVPAIWGPVLWKLLHGIGARAAKKICIVKCQRDEQREIVWLLSHLESIVPCVECKQHIESYKKANPLPHSANEVEQWLWTFHEAVNTRLGKPAGPPLSDLHIYLQIGMIQEFQIYQKMLQESLQKGGVKGDAVREWKRHLWLLNACY